MYPITSERKLCRFVNTTTYYLKFKLDWIDCNCKFVTNNAGSKPRFFQLFTRKLGWTGAPGPGPRAVHTGTATSQTHVKNLTVK